MIQNEKKTKIIGVKVSDPHDDFYQRFDWYYDDRSIIVGMGLYSDRG
jgi:hypothetical protein